MVSTPAANRALKSEGKPRRRPTASPNSPSGCRSFSAQLLRLQRSAGNRATAQLVTRAKALAAAGKSIPQRSSDRPVVQRVAKQHFFRFMNTKLPTLDASNAGEKDALIAAWILDQNIYEIEAMLKGTYAEEALGDMLNNQALLAQKGIVLSDVGEFLARLGAPGPGSEGQMEWLNGMMPELSFKLTATLAELTKTKAGGPTSVIRWHGLTPWGAGTGASLLMQPGGIPAGSSAGGDPVWMKQVEQHLPSGGNTTLYVRGHLLNYDLGGPGLDYNMVPITGKPAKNVGGNDANGEHFHAVENAAKGVLGEVLAGRYQQGFYEVIPLYNRTARAESGTVRNQAVALRKILDDALESRRLAISGRGATVVAKEYGDLHAAHGLTAPAQLPSFWEQVETLARYQTHEFETQTLGALHTSKDPVAVEIVSKVDLGVLHASAQGATANRKPRDLLHLLEGNAATWEAEDRHIPTALKVRLEWLDGTGTYGAKVVPDIPVTLSTNTSAVYFRPKKGAEDA